MTVLNKSMASLLDKLYNLRGEESTILLEMEDEKNSLEDIRTKTSISKSELETKLDDLGNEEKDLNMQGQKFKSIVDAFNFEDFSGLIEKLELDFNPGTLAQSFDEKLPEVLGGIASEKESTRNELTSTVEEMNEAITKLEELNIRKAEALANQERLNRYFDLSLTSNINITRDEITSLIEKFGFDEEEQRTIAKILMFPEDGLFEYEKLREENPDAKAIAKLLKGSKSKTKDDDEEEDEKEDEKEKQVEKIETEEPREEELEDGATLEDTPVEEIKVETMEASESDPIIDFTLPTIDPVETKKTTKKEKKEEVKEAVPTDSKEALTLLLNKIGLDYLNFSSEDFESLVANMDEELYTDNVKLVDALGINNDLFTDNAELLYDKDLKNKITKLTEVGKLPQDIYLNPSILVKYNYTELEDAINELVASGLEPKKVPLIAY